ncbi:hypothetical protein AVEN_183637-1 [Araneus ventricosus]|uniref:Receptor ligand binding region domain-containing protein n=1 Tax=Araneus ventricosus TaxID=182803 RepID=A0A4Y2V4S7_ARAVE|nr:hypothetical protein AVEN_183637-1 [Araneus ventricosus]
MLDWVNYQKDFLPSIKLITYVLDDCDKDTYGLEQAVYFIKGKAKFSAVTATFLFDMENKKFGRRKLMVGFDFGSKGLQVQNPISLNIRLVYTVGLVYVKSEVSRTSSRWCFVEVSCGRCQLR